jgi:hypothetical protein
VVGVVEETVAQQDELAQVEAARVRAVRAVAAVAKVWVASPFGAKRLQAVTRAVLQVVMQAAMYQVLEATMFDLEWFALLAAWVVHRALPGAP